MRLCRPSLPPWLAGLALLSACDLFLPVLPPLRQDAQRVQVEELWSVPTDALMGTDVAPLASGGFGVLDGYRGRAILFDASHTQTGIVGDLERWSSPVRATPRADGSGWWLALPSSDSILAISPPDTAAKPLPITLPDGSPASGTVAVLDTGTSLLVGLHSGAILVVDPATGQAQKIIDRDAEGDAFSAIGDLALDSDGHVLAVDPLAARIHRLDSQGEPQLRAGRFGMWIGSLNKPKSIATGPEDTMIVADSALGALQLFDHDGRPLGALASGDDLLRFEHVVAVTAIDDTHFLALDSANGEVHGFTLTAASVADARDQAAGARFLRTSLSDRDQTEARRCYECHDGTIEDSRFIWDPNLGHHPVGEKPDRELPSFYPLDDEGRMTCGTCHSPHGGATLAEVRQVEEGEKVADLIRHAPTGDALFTRLSREHSALCVGCHEAVLGNLGLEGTGHPVGEALEKALAKRETQSGAANLPEGVDGSCLTCHAVHGAAGDGLARATDDGSICAACHPAQARPERNHPVGKKPRRHAEGFPLAGEGVNTCRTCHDLVAGEGEVFLRARQDGGLMCQACHTRSKLGAGHDEVHGSRGLSCLGCHAVHDGPADHALLIEASSATRADPLGCLGCHEDDGAGTHGHPVGVQDLTCNSCHTEPHDPTRVPTCGSCHKEQHDLAKAGGHGRAECADCHPVHAPEPTLASAPADLNPASTRCLACHAPGPGSPAPTVASWDHPTPVFHPDGSRWTPLGGLTLFAADGTPAPPSENGDLTCQTCHFVHGPGEGAGDKLRRPGWEAACASCHADNALLLYRYFHKPAVRRAQGVTP